MPKKEIEDNDIENKKAFIITPIGEKGSPIHIEACGLIDTIIKPVLQSKKFEIVNPMESTKAGSITRNIISDIINDKLVIVNLTNQNPNVMYELAIRQSTNKPVVILIRADQIQKIPFDIKDQRVISYSDQLYGAGKLKDQLARYIVSAIENPVDSPIFDATKKIILTGKNGNEEVSIQDALTTIINKIDDIRDSNNLAASTDNIEPLIYRGHSLHKVNRNSVGEIMREYDKIRNGND